MNTTAKKVRKIVKKALEEYSTKQLMVYMNFVQIFEGHSTRVCPKISGLVAWSENCKYSSLPLGAVVSLFCESV
jgi:hypothetical protein